jgi:hypothetical protein
MSTTLANGKKSIVFTLMPFGGDHDDIYRYCVKPTIERFDFECRRADEIPDPTNITADIINNIDTAALVIADLTGGNPNVFYELALAHAFNKPTIMISRDVDNIPFDLLTYRVILYKNEAKELEYLKGQLGGMLTAYGLGRLSFETPLTVHLKTSALTSVSRTDEVLQRESKAIERVCVIAPDIALGPSNFRDVMQINLKSRKIRYQYLIASQPAIIESYEAFVESMNLGAAEGLLTARHLDPEYIESDVTIIDPATPYEIGFILAPPDHPEYHYRVVGSSLYRLKDRFDKLWHKAQVIP